MTIFGASVGGNSGSVTIATEDARFGHIRAVRQFSSGMPGNLAAGLDTSRTLFYSFKAVQSDYTGMAGGVYDAAIRTWLRGLPAGQPVYVTYYHEPENNFPSGASFAKAQDHFISLVHSTTGVVANVKVNIIFTAYILSYGKGSIPGGHSSRNIADWWPTTYKPDMVSFDFDDSNAARTSFFDWISIGYGSWAQQFAASKGIPWSVTECGSIRTTGDTTHAAYTTAMGNQAAGYVKYGASFATYWDDSSAYLTTTNEINMWAALVGATYTNLIAAGSSVAHYVASGTLTGLSGVVIPPVPAPPPTPSPAPPVIPSSWAVTLVDAVHIPGGGIIGDLTTASQIVTSLKVADPSTIQFTVDGLHPEALYAPQGSFAGAWVGFTDVMVYRTDGSGTNLTGRYRLNQAADTFDAAGPTFTILFSGIAYKGLLAARVVGEHTSDFSTVSKSSGIAFVGATSLANGSTTAPQVTLPSGIGAGNIITIFVGVANGGTAVTITPPPGYTTLAAWGSEAVGVNGQQGKVYWKRATGIESSTTLTFTLSAATKSSITSYVVSDASGGIVPTIVTGTDPQTSSTSHTAPLSGTLTNPGWVAEWYSIKSSTNATYTTPAGTTLRTSAFGSPSGTSDALLVDYNGNVSSGGGGTTTSGTASTYGVSATLLLAGSGGVNPTYTNIGITVDASSNPVRTYAAGIDIANVIWDLLKMTQTGTGRTANCNYGVTPSTQGFVAGVGNTGILTPTGGISFQPGQNIMDAINQVCAGGDPSNGNLPTGQQAGADWDIDANLSLQVWPKTTTSQGKHSATFDPTAPFVLDAPEGNITSFQRTFDLSTYGNYAITAGTSSGSATGSSTNAKLTTQFVQAVNLPTASEGRWVRYMSVQAASQTILNQIGAYNLYNINDLNGTYTLNIQPGSWVFTDCGVGDLVQIFINVGARQVNVIDRLMQLDITSDDDGFDKTIIMTIARPDPHDISQFLGKLYDRLASLELRS